MDRPAAEGADRKLTFTEVAAGRYEAMTGAAEAGAWILAFTAQKPRLGGDPTVYRAKERLWIEPAH